MDQVAARSYLVLLDHRRRGRKYQRELESMEPTPPGIPSPGRPDPPGP